ncbi:MAG: hypothetical protein ABR564_07515 [Candidatus Dormibacteria bacterium]
MRRPEALVLEDNPRELEEVVAIVSACGLDAFGTRSPRQAIRWLTARDDTSRGQGSGTSAVARPTSHLFHSPVLAVVDWNMEYSPDDVPTAEEVLRALARVHRDAVTVVYGTGVGIDLRLQNRIADHHPGAITHDKRHGSVSLITRLRNLMMRTVGDLQVDAGFVVHESTGRRYPHEVAVKLLLAHPRPVYVERGTGSYQALWRFMRWLAKGHSNVSVVAQGRGFHRLEVGPEAD